MEQREIKLTILSGQGLKNVKLSGGAMSPYAVAWIRPQLKSATPEHSQGGVNPSWNSMLRLTCDEISFQNGHITIEIYHHGSFSNKLVGTVTVPLSDFNEQREAAGSQGSNKKRLMTYQVRRPSGKFQGVINLSVEIGKLVDQAESQSWTNPVPAGLGAGLPGMSNDDRTNNQPVIAQPAAVPYSMPGSNLAGPSGAQYPPQQFNQQFGYPPPGYQPQYAQPVPYFQQAQPVPYYQQAQPYPAPYPAYVPPPRRSSGFGGAGFGTGLLGGALGGMLLGSALDGGDGFGDGGGCGGGCGGF